MSRGDNLPATGWFRGEGRPAPWPGAARGGGNALRHIVGDQGDRAVVLNAARRSRTAATFEGLRTLVSGQ